MRASLNNHRTAPRKVRLVADLVRGKSVSVAKQKLAFLPKKTAPVIEKLLDSAIAKRKCRVVSPEELFIKTITVNKGGMQKRYRPFARGPCRYDTKNYESHRDRAWSPARPGPG